MDFPNATSGNLCWWGDTFENIFLSQLDESDTFRTTALSLWISKIIPQSITSGLASASRFSTIGSSKHLKSWYLIAGCSQGLLLRPSDQDVCREFSVQNARKRPENGSHLAQGDIPDYFKPGLRTELYILHRALTRSWWPYCPELQTFCPWNVPHIEKEQRPGVRQYPWKSWPRLPFFNAQFGWLPS